MWFVGRVGRLFFTNNNKKHQQFKINIKKITEPTYLMHVINTPHPLRESNRMLRAMTSGAVSLTRHNFSSIFKKYAYYVEQIPKGKSYGEASFEDKLTFLDCITNIYWRLGRISSQHLTKTFNKVSDQIYEQLKDKKIEEYEKCLQHMLIFLNSVTRYNMKKCKYLYKSL